MEADVNQQLPETLTLELKKPVVLKDQTITSLDLREPTAGEFDKMAQKAQTNPYGAQLLLISLVSGHALPLVERMGVRDIQAAGDYLLGFTQPGQSTATS